LNEQSKYSSISALLVQKGYGGGEAIEGAKVKEREGRKRRRVETKYIAYLVRATVGVAHLGPDRARRGCP
jgi:hypothetical protein